MTAQEVSTLVRENLNPIIFLINNDGYTIERVIRDGAFNDLHMWKYSELPLIFNGGWGCAIKTEGELEAALQKAREHNNELALIEIQIDRWDCSDSLRELGAAYKQK
jgi:indolepyruvate decarboxylase